MSWPPGLQQLVSVSGSLSCYTFFILSHTPSGTCFVSYTTPPCTHARTHTHSHTLSYMFIHTYSLIERQILFFCVRLFGESHLRLSPSPVLGAGCVLVLNDCIDGGHPERCWL